MKKIFSIVMLFVGGFFTSCNEDSNEIIVSQNQNKMIVHAVIGEQTDSRVVLTQQDNGNIKTTWKDGDAFLGVANGTMIEFTGGKSDGTVADFSSNNEVNNGVMVNALYPLSDEYKNNASSVDGFEISLAGQNGTLEKLADYTYMTAQAIATDNVLNFKFKHEIVILRLTGMTFPDEISNVSEIVVSGTGISDVAVANLSGSTPVVKVSATDCSVNVKGNFTVSDKVMQDVYVAFFPTEEISNLTISAITSNSRPYHFSYNGSVKQLITGKVYTLKNISLAKGHVAVDLGLSVKWAMCNVGATSMEEYGGYYAWGATTTGPDYRHSPATFNWDVNSTGKLGDIASTESDVATVLWGESWKMPTKDEMEELLTKCSWEHVYMNGTYGFIVRGVKVNDDRDCSKNFIFLPCADNHFSSSTSYPNPLVPFPVFGEGKHCFYWTSTRDESNTNFVNKDTYAYSLSITNNDNIITKRVSQRKVYGGLTVRPVYIENVE